MFGNPYNSYYPQQMQPQQTYQPMDQLAQFRSGQAPQMPTPQPQQAQGGITWVQGEEGAKAYLVAAGNSVMLMDSEARTFYIKSTDASGMPMPLKIYDYTERTVQPKPQEPAAEYVTREEFSRFAEKLDKLAHDLGETEEK